MTTTLQGYWYLAGSSGRCDAQLQINGDEYGLRYDNGVQRTGVIHELLVSDRIGNIPRTLRWSDGSLFETDDNDAVDRCLAQQNHSGQRKQWIHRLERSWGWAMASLLLVAVVAGASYIWGLPAAAYRIAHSLPVEAHEAISAGALSTLDKIFLDPTKLSTEQQAEIQSRFALLASAVPRGEFSLKLHFRSMRVNDTAVPNAFALPGGDIVVTDALIELADRPEQLDSVLLHEMGHVLQRHGMQQVIQASAITLVVSMAIGDVSGAGELVVGVPIFLMQSSYSRSSETQADTFAFEQMMALDMDPAHFATMITKLGADLDDETTANSAVDAPDSEQSHQRAERRKHYFSTHPGTQQRAERAREYSRQYHAQ